MTVKDVPIAIKIWGPLVTKAKGNMVRQPAKANPTSIVSVPKELPTQPTLLLVAQGEHVGSVERSIRYLYETVRLLRYTLPFTKIPKYILIYMVFAATKVMNMF